MLEVTAWMAGIAVVLYAVPFLNALLGGLVGGARAGSVRRALAGAALSALLLTGFTLAFRAGFVAPIWDLGRGDFPLLPVVNASALLLGALLGSLPSSLQRRPRRVP